MIKLYAPFESGRVVGIDGNEYRIQNGLVFVPEHCVAALIGLGYTAENTPVEGVQLVITYANPVVETPKKRAKKA